MQSKKLCMLLCYTLFISCILPISINFTLAERVMISTNASVDTCLITTDILPGQKIGSSHTSNPSTIRPMQRSENPKSNPGKADKDLLSSLVQKTENPDRKSGSSLVPIQSVHLGAIKFAPFLFKIALGAN